MGQDYTHHRNQGNVVYASIYTNPDSVYLAYADKKGYVGLKEGYAGLKGGPLAVHRSGKKDGYNQPGFEGIVVGDHDATLNGAGGSKQECLVHIQRALRRIKKMAPNTQWTSRMRALLKEAMEAAKKGPVSKVLADRFKSAYAKILSDAAKEYPNGRPVPRGFKIKGKTKQGRILMGQLDGWRLMRRMSKHPDDYLRFLDHPEIPYHNQACETAARQLKRRTKIIDGFRSQKGAEDTLKALSVILTARKRGQNIYQLIEHAFGADTSL